MLVLVHASPTTLERHRRPNLGVFNSPDRWYSAEQLVGWRWAADNGAFGEFNPEAFRRMLDGLHGLPGCLFVAAPDVVGDAECTLELFEEWYDELVAAWQPIALVAQDGLVGGDDRVPWSRIDALFIGGSTEFKLGLDAAELAREARTRGKHVHWGRVSSLRRKRYIASVGGINDSIDGNINNRWRDRWLDMNVAAAAAPAQGRLVP